MAEQTTPFPSRPLTIALDAMGGDNGAKVVVPAARRYLETADDVELILVGREETIVAELAGFEHPRLHVHHASQVVEMDEPPSRALRGKKDSSMRVAIDLVKQGAADACVSAGNTGALMATARFVLKMLPRIERPAIITAIPSLKGHTWVLDLGANIDSTANHLFQFAVMGSELVSLVDDLPAPRIGLLNIGQEEIKGNEQVKAAHAILSKSSLNYLGYVEGDDIYTGDVDVVVTDGFVGNVALKASEGVAKLVRYQLNKGFKASLLRKLQGLIALPVLREFQKAMDPRRYNGASLLGLRGIVIKSHGGADVLAFTNALRIAHEEVEKDIGARITSQVERQLAGGTA